jgi:CDP-diacylglycerol--glycerol-3-phosphate 3-phosphatidyltransferase
MKPEHKPTIIDIFFSRTILKAIPMWVMPNWVTVFRFLTIPIILYLLIYEQYVWSLLVFAVSAFSDAVDGAMARTRDQVTDWGKTFDPFADKLLIGGVAAVIVTRYVNPYLAAVILAIELLLIINAFYRKTVEHKVVQAQFAGKLKMILQSVALIILFFNIIYPLPILIWLATYVLYIAILFALASLVVYRSV